MQLKYTAAMAIILLGSALTGCSGSGGGTTSAGAGGDGSNVSVKPPICLFDGKFCSIYNSYIARRLSHRQADESTKTLSIRPIKADAAYQRGYDGTGVTLGYYEYGIHANHPELEDVLVSDDKQDCQPGHCGNVLNTETNARNHGTSLAAIAAGRRNGLDSTLKGMHGVVPGARVRFISFRNADFNLQVNDRSRGHAPAIGHLNPRVPIAFSAQGGSINPTTPTYLRLPQYVPVVDALRQADRPASGRTIWVFPAENRSLATPSGFASYGIYILELRDHVLSAVALDEDGAIWSDSNRCGTADSYCIAAPGKAFSALYSPPTKKPTYATTYGTSNATPVVAAALAILKQAFPSIGNHELVRRLLSTANKSGIYEDTAIYGQGVVDLDAATRPYGQSHIPLGNSVDGKSALMSLSTVQAAVPTGNALAQGFAGRRMMILDDLDTPFYAGLESFVTTDNSPNPVSEKTRDLMSRLVHGTSQSNVSTSPWLQVAGQPQAYRNGSRKIKSWYSAGNRDSFGFASRQPPRKKGKATISFTAGAMLEPHSHLGSTFYGAFGSLSAGTFLTGIDATRPCGTWTCQASGSLGVSLMRPAGGMVQSSKPTIASSFSLQALKTTPEYGLFIELAQPLRVESGSVEIAYPSARTPDRKILSESFSAALSPVGRQIDLQAGTILPLSKNSALGAQAWISHNPPT